MPRFSGFTLLEMMIVLTVLGVLATLSLSGINGSVAAGHSAAERGALTEALLVALNHSMISGHDVVLCASDDGASCTGGIDWTAGWIAFIDRDSDRLRDPDEGLLRVRPRLAPEVHLRSSVGRTHIVFQAHGGATAGSNVTFTLCDTRGASAASTLVLANSGRMRSTSATVAQATACLTGS
jgi:type IV fimbrial biogenesis protein FimT